MNFLDPFVTRKCNQLDFFPDPLTTDEISSFCFPNGLSIRLIPKTLEIMLIDSDG